MLTRRRRTKILVSATEDFRGGLADEIRRTHRVVELQPGKLGLVMLTVRETAQNTRFHPGEILVTEARCEVDGFLGIGLIAGDHSQAAADLAVIDGAFNAALPLLADWLPRLLAEEDRQLQEQRQDLLHIQSSKVVFESMDQARPS